MPWTARSNGLLASARPDTGLLALPGALFLLTACAATSSDARSHTPAHAAPLEALASPAGDVAMPGPAPLQALPGAPSVPRADIAAQNRACEQCHAVIADEWRASLHRSAHTDPIYKRALAIEPLAFCRSCHAPEADPRADPPFDLGQMGVGCVSCHLVSGTILAATNKASSARAPHAITRDARFGSAAACARCHEFAFPDSALRRTPALMQSTVTEHARSAATDRACADCHMPDAGGHRSHAFVGARDEAFVRSAAGFTAVRVGSIVRVTVDASRLGHALPTGDLFRRLEVSAEAEGADHLVVASARRYLTRHFRDERLPLGVTVRTVARDDRPQRDQAQFDLSLDEGAHALPITWRVTYQRVEHPRSDRAEDALVEGEILLAHGVLAPVPNTLPPMPQSTLAPNTFLPSPAQP